jgi:hypothetical protein
LAEQISSGARDHKRFICRASAEIMIKPKRVREHRSPRKRAVYIDLDNRLIIGEVHCRCRAFGLALMLYKLKVVHSS